MNAKKFILVIVSTAIFPWLFYENYLGVNLFIFNILVLSGLFITKNLNLKNTLNRTIVSGSFLSSLFVVFNGSDFAITINILSLFLLGGSSFFPKWRNLIVVSFQSIISFFNSQLRFFSALQEMASGKKNLSKVLRILKLIIIPLIVFFLFIIIYKEANPVFEGYVKTFFDAIESFFDWFFENIEFALIMTFILGFVFSNFFFFGSKNSYITDIDEKSSKSLERKKFKSSRKIKMTGLKTEHKSAIIMFSSLNILLLVVNIIDISWVWFDFEWNGQYLKQFVHEGTWLLIISIIISLVISIFYFRGNINFLKNNNLLRKLAYVWLAQNAVLTVSVGIRNFWYIYYFALAYKRIGVIFFLILTLYSIYTVYQKINHKKTTFYLLSSNSLASYIILVVMAFFNWDSIIAKYNFAHSETAFVHFNFLANLSNNALPYLDRTPGELKAIDKVQQNEFPFRTQYMTSEEYSDKISIKKNSFIQEWPNRNWLEWNLAGERSYRSMKAKGY